MLVNQMTNSGTWYQNQNRYYGFGGMNNVSQQQWCYYLCLANMLCNCCMGGRGGFFFF
jgi:molecular chaperone DnaJ